MSISPLAPLLASLPRLRERIEHAADGSLSTQAAPLCRKYRAASFAEDAEKSQQARWIEGAGTAPEGALGSIEILVPRMIEPPPSPSPLAEVGISIEAEPFAWKQGGCYVDFRPRADWLLDTTLPCALGDPEPNFVKRIQDSCPPSVYPLLWQVEHFSAPPTATQQRVWLLSLDLCGSAETADAWQSKLDLCALGFLLTGVVAQEAGRRRLHLQTCIPRCSQAEPSLPSTACLLQAAAACIASAQLRIPLVLHVRVESASTSDTLRQRLGNSQDILGLAHAVAAKRMHSIGDVAGRVLQLVAKEEAAGTGDLSFAAAIARAKSLSKAEVAPCREQTTSFFCDALAPACLWKAGADPPCKDERSLGARDRRSALRGRGARGCQGATTRAECLSLGFGCDWGTTEAEHSPSCALRSDITPRATTLEQKEAAENVAGKKDCGQSALRGLLPARDAGLVSELFASREHCRHGPQAAETFRRVMVQAKARGAGLLAEPFLASDGSVRSLRGLVGVLVFDPLGGAEALAWVSGRDVWVPVGGIAITHSAAVSTPRLLQLIASRSLTAVAVSSVSSVFEPEGFRTGAHAAARMEDCGEAAAKAVLRYKHEQEELSLPAPTRGCRTPEEAAQGLQKMIEGMHVSHRPADPPVQASSFERLGGADLLHSLRPSPLLLGLIVFYAGGTSEGFIALRRGHIFQSVHGASSQTLRFQSAEALITNLSSRHARAVVVLSVRRKTRPPEKPRSSQRPLAEVLPVPGSHPRALKPSDSADGTPPSTTGNLKDEDLPGPAATRTPLIQEALTSPATPPAAAPAAFPATPPASPPATPPTSWLGPALRATRAPAQEPSTPAAPVAPLTPVAVTPATTLGAAINAHHTVADGEPPLPSHESDSVDFGQDEPESEADASEREPRQDDEQGDEQRDELASGSQPSHLSGSDDGAHRGPSAHLASPARRRRSESERARATPEAGLDESQLEAPDPFHISGRSRSTSSSEGLFEFPRRHRGPDGLPSPSQPPNEALASAAEEGEDTAMAPVGLADAPGSPSSPSRSRSSSSHSYRRLRGADRSQARRHPPEDGASTLPENNRDQQEGDGGQGDGGHGDGGKGGGKGGGGKGGGKGGGGKGGGTGGRGPAGRGRGRRGKGSGGKGRASAGAARARLTEVLGRTRPSGGSRRRSRSRGRHRRGQGRDRDRDRDRDRRRTSRNRPRRR